MDLEDMIKAYHDKVEEDFSFDINDTSSVDMAKKVRNSLIPMQPTFLSSLVRLATSAKSESVRFNAIKFGIEAVYGKNIVSESEDSLNDLLNDLRNNDSKVQEESNSTY